MKVKNTITVLTSCKIYRYSYMLTIFIINITTISRYGVTLVVNLNFLTTINKCKWIYNRIQYSCIDRGWKKKLNYNIDTAPYILLRLLSSMLYFVSHKQTNTLKILMNIIRKIKTTDSVFKTHVMMFGLDKVVVPEALPNGMYICVSMCICT